MNVYDHAHALARALHSSPEFQKFDELKKKVMAHPTTKKMVTDFQKKLMELQATELVGKKPDPEEIEKFEKLQQVISLNPTVAEFLTAQMKLGRLLADIQKILADAIDMGSDEDFLEQQ